MKTLFIYVDGDGFLPEYFIVDGDYRKFESFIINVSEDDTLAQELSDFLYHKETGKPLHERSNTFPLNQKFDYVVTCGFAP